MSYANFIDVAALVSGTLAKEPIWLLRARGVWQLISLLRYLTNVSLNIHFRQNTMELGCTQLKVQASRSQKTIGEQHKTAVEKNPTNQKGLNIVLLSANYSLVLKNKITVKT